MTGLGYALVYTGCAVFIIGTIRHGMQLTLADVAADALIAAGDALMGGLFLIMSAAFAAQTVLMAWRWWNNGNGRRRRGRLAAAGHKARARIAAMTARMRERPARPALRPAPAGTR